MLRVPVCAHLCVYGLCKYAFLCLLQVETTTSFLLFETESPLAEFSSSIQLVTLEKRVVNI